MSLSSWLLADLQVPKNQPVAPDEDSAHKNAWWRVMCLTGVDYFSTLGYQPGIAFLAAGVLSPIATFVLVVVTLFAALPVYKRVAAASPNGQGSIAMLEKLFPSWGGKLFVLVLLGFATTDFIITMTLSAADAAAHFIHNPFTPHILRSQMAVTLVLLAILGAIFLKGFKEAITIAVVLVAAYLVLNGVVTVVALREVIHHAELIPQWKQTLFQQHGSVWKMLGISIFLFPQLALGLSGFETGVAVMPLVVGHTLDDRIRNTRHLLSTAAIVMSVFLMFTSFVTTLLIPASAFREGGPANGRAMAYLAHHYLGSGFGAAYDISTILILAFAGASAMAGLLNLIPRYLPRFGMAPEWAKASRPLVLVFMAIAFTVTLLFHADVDAQGGAYATGVLVLMTSGSCAVTTAARRGWPKILFSLISLVFIYTTLMNVRERPEGIKIAAFFIVAIIFFSLISRVLRSTELRVTEVCLSGEASSLLAEDEDQLIRLIAWNPQSAGAKVRNDVEADVRRLHGLADDERIYFLEVERTDASEFDNKLEVCGHRDGKHNVLTAQSPVVANAIAALLLTLRDSTGHNPHAYFQWTEFSPAVNVLRFLFLGQGDAAPLAQEVLRPRRPRQDQTPGHPRGIISACFGPEVWWAVRDSNPRHPACKAGALTN